MVAPLLLAASLASAADRRVDAPRIELPPMAVSAPTGAAIPGSLAAAPIPSATVPSIPALPAAAMAEAGAPVATPVGAAPAGITDISATGGNGAPARPAPPGPPSADDPSKPGFARKVGRILARIVDPFGGGKKPEQVSPALAARRASYAKATAADHWTAVKPELQRELAALRALKDKKQKQQFLRQVGSQVVAALETRHGAKELGFHFNLHGGRPDGYVDGNGIRATMGDIALNHTTHGDRNHKVYFFRSSKVNLYDALDESDPAQLFIPSRMGDVFMAFRLDAQALERGRAAGAITSEGQISMDFDMDKMRGVPYEAFVVPPTQVFRVPKSLGLGKLTRDEETLAAMRYIEALGTGADTPLAR